MLSAANGATSRPLTAIEYGGDLKRLCQADSKSGEYAMCFSFVGAVLEVVYNQPIYGFQTCVPRLTTVDRALELIREWQQKHPETDTKPASYVIAEALNSAFPCKQ